ncbi:hypothetical protein E2R51_03140 [Jeotgalibacillus sp. S-D1]|uniref:heptaprenyl diphosphate synthase component 1 n=1 Tax=Jeotgalibacillus sp. S-D1 TaxID=2552189 RepID=UPI001059BCE4|nr:heptaprenyl diphosphate synthase component 1 [Jeotgalibacillus sp. S-D1]TDL34730.1 hypothetical protein E2R51_03140 [Jeotgalibacillus sp. S-D1]
MNVKDTNRWMEETLQHINNQIHHPYLHDSIGAPDFDENRLSLLLFPYQIRGNYSVQDKSYVSTAMLIQTALDTHEKVSDDQTGSLRIRQLTVLAGDFYSGLYYRTLAQMPDIELIRRIAHAIQEINEHKIDITSNMPALIDSVIFSLTKIESAIITELFKHNGFDEYVILAEDLLVLHRLIKEEIQYSSSGTSILFSHLERTLPKTTSLFREKQLMDLYFDLVLHKKEQIFRRLDELNIPVNSLKGPIFSVLHSSIERPKIYAEEG